MVIVSEAIEYGTSSSDVAREKKNLIEKLVSLKEATERVIRLVENNYPIDRGQLFMTRSANIEMMAVEFNSAITTKRWSLPTWVGW